MTVQEMRDAISTMCDVDPEMRNIFAHLNRTPNWPVDEIFRQMVLIEELKKRMKEDVVNFTFTKKDGSNRTAFGTRASDVIVRHEGAAVPPESHRNGATGTFPYFDIERQAWRSFRVGYLSGINRGYTV